MRSGGWNHRRNFDGFVTWSPEHGRDGWTRSYVQTFRNGAVEATLNDFTHQDKIPIVAVEQMVIDMYDRVRDVYAHVGIGSPVAVMLTLLGVKGRQLAVGPGLFGDYYPIDRDDLLIPDIEVGSSEQPSEALRPAFDMVWQAAGFSRSFGYNADGTRR